MTASRAFALLSIGLWPALAGCTCRGETAREVPPIRPEPVVSSKKVAAKVAAPDAAPAAPAPDDAPFDNVAADDGKFPFVLVPRGPTPVTKPSVPPKLYLIPTGWDPATNPAAPDDYKSATTSTPFGVEIRSYEFVGASDSAFGLELVRDGKRALLLRDIQWWRENPSKELLYLQRDGLAIVD
ncbi:MAG: hypothetical protein ABI175_22765, partial [Polyangiales bacterium]